MRRIVNVASIAVLCYGLFACMAVAHPIYDWFYPVADWSIGFGLIGSVVSADWFQRRLKNVAGGAKLRPDDPGKLERWLIKVGEKDFR